MIVSLTPRLKTNILKRKPKWKKKKGIFFLFVGFPFSFLFFFFSFLIVNLGETLDLRQKGYCWWKEFSKDQIFFPAAQDIYEDNSEL